MASLRFAVRYQFAPTVHDRMRAAEAAGITMYFTGERHFAH